MSRSTFGLVTALALLTCATNAHAIIIGGGVTGGSAASAGGTFAQLSFPFTPPNGAENEVGQDTFQSPNLWAFNEDQNIDLDDALSVDLLVASGLSGSLAAGTTVASHYVFFDPAFSQRQAGYVDFDSDILAVITSTARLSASDFLANTNVIYLNPTLRGLEAGDSAAVDASLSTRLVLDWSASSPGDFIRVLTARSIGGEDPCATNPPGVGGCLIAISEPASPSLLALGVLGLVLVRRRRLIG